MATVVRGASTVVLHRVGVCQESVSSSLSGQLASGCNRTTAPRLVQAAQLPGCCHSPIEIARLWSELCFLVLPYYMPYLTACASGSPGSEQLPPLTIRTVRSPKTRTAARR